MLRGAYLLEAKVWKKFGGDFFHAPDSGFIMKSGARTKILSEKTDGRFRIVLPQIVLNGTT